MLTPRRIDLHLPTAWNACTVNELECLAQVLADRAASITPFHQFDMDEVKVAMFFLLAQIRVVEPINPRIPVEEQYYVCERTYQTESLWRRWWKKVRGKNEEPFNLPLAAIHGWIESELGWLDINGLTKFPYPTLTLWHHGRRVTFEGPHAFMNEFTWQRYRFAQDYMEYYIGQYNRALEMQRKQFKYRPDEILKQAKIADQARASFLATIFCRKIRTVDARTKEIRHEFAYQSNQHVDNAEYFRNFDDVKWQVVMFWWNGMMYELQRRYPKCFKKQSTKKTGVKGNDPLDLYTCSTSMLEKYLSWDQEKVNREMFHNILRHMDNIAKENEETEKMKRKK